MTNIWSQEVQCCNCGKSSRHFALSSTNSFGQLDLDLRKPGMARYTMNSWLQLCRYCGNCSPDVSQPLANITVLKSNEYRKALQRRDIPLEARKFLAYAIALTSPQYKYGILGRVFNWGAVPPVDPRKGARAFHHAAWCCDDAAQPDQATEFRQRSADWFLKSKPYTDDKEGIFTAVVLTDLLRRCGRFREASLECEALLGSHKIDDVVRSILQIQQQLIASGDIDGHKLKEPARTEPSKKHRK